MAELDGLEDISEVEGLTSNEQQWVALIARHIRVAATIAIFIAGTSFAVGVSVGILAGKGQDHLKMKGLLRALKVAQNKLGPPLMKGSAVSDACLSPYVQSVIDDEDEGEDTADRRRLHRHGSSSSRQGHKRLNLAPDDLALKSKFHTERYLNELTCRESTVTSETEPLAVASEPDSLASTSEAEQQGLGIGAVTVGAKEGTTGGVGAAVESCSVKPAELQRAESNSHRSFES